MISGLLYTVFGLIEGVLVLRLLLRLLGANPGSGFVDLIYGLSTPLVTPFAGVFGQEATVAGPGVVTHSVFDWSALVALIVYGIIGTVIANAAMGYYRRRPTEL